MVTETKEELSEVEMPGTEEETGAKAESESGEIEETGKEKEEPIVFNSQAELDKAVEKKAQALADSIADRGLKTYQEQIKTLKQQVKEATYKKEDDALARLEQAQTDDWGQTEQVGDFQEQVKKFVKERREFNSKVDEWEENHQKATQSVREVNAFTDALALLLPEDDAGFISELTTLAEKIAGAQTDREKELLIELEKAKLQALAGAKDEKPRRTKPDTNLPSAPGGRDLSKMSPSEQIQEGFKKLIKKTGE